MNMQFFEERNKLTFYTALFIGIVLFLFVTQMSWSAPNFIVQRTIIPEANDTYQIGSSTNPVRRWQKAYFENASTSVFSVHDTLYIGGTATSTILGTATSTFLSGIELDSLYAIRGLSVGGAATTTILGSATSTFARGIDTARGINVGLTSCSGSNALTTNADGAVICGAITSTLNPPDLIYRTLSATKYTTSSSSASDNLAFHFNNGFVSSASSTIASTLVLEGALTNNTTATSTWLGGLSVANSGLASSKGISITGGTSRLGTIVAGAWNATAIEAIYGGTAQTAVTTGDILYGSATNAWSRLGAGTRGTILSLTTGGIPGWVSTSTFAHLNATQTFTGVNSFSAAINASSTLHVTGNTFLGSDGSVFVNSSAPRNTINVTALANGQVGFATSTPNDNATTTTAGVFYAAGAMRNQMCRLTDAATIFVDGNCGNRFRTEMAGNRIIEFHHFYEGQTGIITLQQDATGTRVPTKWIAVNPAGTRRGVVWRAGATTTLSTVANRIDKIGFEMGTDTLFMIASSTNFIPIDY